MPHQLLLGLRLGLRLRERRLLLLLWWTPMLK
jgi:hypothetical protein